MEVSDQIIKVLDEVGKRFGMAIDWTQANIMPYIQQLGDRIVNYELWTSVVWVVLSIVALIVLSIGFKKSIAWYKKADYLRQVDVGVLIFAIVIGIVVCIITIVTQMFDIVTCLTFPEKIIFEFIQQYVK